MTYTVYMVYIYITIQRGNQGALEPGGFGNLNQRASWGLISSKLKQARYRGVTSESFMKSIESRIAELSAIIMESFKDSSVAGAIVWMKAVKERSELVEKLNLIKK